MCYTYRKSFRLEQFFDSPGNQAVHDFQAEESDYRPAQNKKPLDVVCDVEWVLPNRFEVEVEWLEVRETQDLISPIVHRLPRGMQITCDKQIGQRLRLCDTVRGWVSWKNKKGERCLNIST